MFHWEFWPTTLFYIPNLPYAFFLACKAKNAVFFSAANPSIKSSGNGTESKFETLQLIPKDLIPKSIFISKNDSLKTILAKLKKEQLTYPLIVKPDVGFRGLLVKKIESENELKNYVNTFSIDVIIQEFINFTYECGIFYSRNPKEEKGLITSITLKKFMTVLGDGSSTLQELINNNKRTKLFKELLYKSHQEKLNLVLKKDEIFQLSAIGNHSKGTQFINGNHLISKKLQQTFDTLSTKIPGWFYGRIDLKYTDFKDVENGKNFKILEINGIISEPTHIYDATNSTYFQALKSIRNHWKILFEIATTNHRSFKIPYKSSNLFIKEMFELRAYSKKVKALSQKNT